MVQPSEPTILFVGMSHQRTPVAVRERCAVPFDQRARVRAELHRQLGPVVLLSTCGRVELYIEVDPENAGQVEGAARAWFAAHTPLGADEIAPLLEVARGEAAVRRIVRVACGLESALEGEDEVLGQVRRAWLDAGLARTLSPRLDATFRLAVRAGRAARRRTGGGAGASLADAAAAHVALSLGHHHRPRVLVAGSGPMGMRAAHTLRVDLGERLDLGLLGRTPAPLAAHAARLGARPFLLPDLPAALDWADAAIVALRVRSPLIAPEQLAARPRERPLTIVDLSLPRAIEPGAAALPNVSLCDVDGLAEVERGHARWDHAGREQVNTLVEQAVNDYAALAARSDASATLTALRIQADGIRRAQLERTLRRLPHLDGESRSALDALTRAIVNRLLHAPTMRLKGDGADEVAAAVRRVFEVG